MGNSSFLLIIILLVNFAISWWNARTVGMVWVETKQMGGFVRFMAWIGAFMSAAGFSWVYLFIFLIGGQQIELSYMTSHPEHIQALTDEAVMAGFSLGYIILVPGILLSGLFIWITSVVNAWKQRDLASIGVAGWNTFAQIHNTASAMRGIPEAIGSVTKFFGKGGNSKGKGGLLLILLVILALLAGVLTTWGIINQYAGSVPLPKRKPVRA